MSKCIESRAISWLSRERTKATRSFDNALKRSAPADDLINLINKNEILEYLLELSVDAFASSDIDVEIPFDIPKTRCDCLCKVKQRPETDSNRCAVERQMDYLS